MQDLRLASRALCATPVTTAVALLSLAFGIGANTALFSVLDRLLIRTLPVADAARLVFLTDGNTRVRAWSYPVWEQIAERNELFERAAAWSFTRFNLASGGQTQFVDGLWTSGSFFDTLGVPPLLGRTFTEADDRRGGGAMGPVAVISYPFWQRHFGGAGDVVGRPMALDGVRFTIVGVMPAAFFGAEVGRTFDVAAPVANEPLLRGRDSFLDSSGTTFLTVVARLKRVQSMEAATTALRAVQPRIREATLGEIGHFGSQQSIDRYLTTPFTLVSGAAGVSSLRLQYERPLVMLVIVSALVLLIACVNIANVSLARATARRHEMSVRLALGASRLRLVRQLFAESLLLAGAGAAVGLVIASWASRALIRQLSTPTTAVFVDLSVDGRVLAFTLCLAVVTTVLFGTAAAFRASATSPVDALQDEGRIGGAPARRRPADGLIVLQVGMSFVLLVAAGLFVRTFVSLTTRPLGFDAERVLIVGVDSSRVVADPADRLPLYQRARDAVRALPGVGDAALSLTTPGGSGQFTPVIDITDASPVEGPVWANLISPGWFATFGTRLVAGRDVADEDRQGSPRVAVVNETFARSLLRGGNPVGRTFTLYPGTPRSLGPIQVVGVVADAVYTSLRAPVPPTYYLPLAQFDYLSELGIRSISLSVKSATDTPAMLTRPVESALAALDPRLALTFHPLATQVETSVRQERIVAVLATIFGAFALGLVGLGLYGITAYAVTRRRAEIGIRLALGATPRAVVRLIVVRTVYLVGLGAIAGAAVSLWITPIAGTLLYGLQPRDPLTFAAAGVVLAVVALSASILPAWRACRIDPTRVLRGR